jgi:LPS sulfotransferase NodH
MKKLLFVCTTPRTGSSVLVGDMRGTEEMGNPREYFNLGGRYRSSAEKWGIDFDDLDGYIAEVKKRTGTDNGVVGVKIFELHLDQMARQGLLPKGPGRLRALAGRFGEPEPVILTLTRRNKLRQAMSLLKARQTGKYGSGGTAKGKAKYDQKALTNGIVEMVKREVRWERELRDSGYRPDLALVYEDHIDPVAERQAVILRLAERLELADPAGALERAKIGGSTLVRQADETTEAWIDKYIGWH